MPKLGICIDLSKPVYKARTHDTDVNGHAFFELIVEQNLPPGFVWMQALEVNHRKVGPITSNVLMLEGGN